VENKIACEVSRSQRVRNDETRERIEEEGSTAETNQV
jgi:hypothetical protein